MLDPIAVRPELGFWYSAAQTYEPVSWAGPGAFGQSCAAGTDFCAAMIRVRVGSIEDGVALPNGDLPADLRGSTLDDVATSWTDLFGTSTFDDLTIDGNPARLASTGTGEGVRTGAFTLESGRLFTIEGSGLTGDSALLVREFVANFHFLPAGCWMLPCDPAGLRWVDPDPELDFQAAAALGSWTGGHGWASGSALDDVSTRGFWLKPCADNLCQGYVTVAVGTTATGAVIDLPGNGRGPVRVSGADLEALQASWAQHFTLDQVDPIEIDGVRGVVLVPALDVRSDPGRQTPFPTRQTVLFVVRERVIALNVFSGFLGNEPANVVLQQFLPGLSFLDEPRNP